MARKRRIYIPELPQHLVHRGVNRDPVFRGSPDYSVFATILREAARRSDVEIHAYAFMSNHIHLMVTPRAEYSLPCMMQAVGRAYVPFFNRRYERTGTLWEGRYRTSLLNDENYWLTCLRYIELNPVRAGIVPKPEDYKWSSYRSHALGMVDPLVTPHALYLRLGGTSSERERAWRSICLAPIPEDTAAEFRYAANTNRPLGGAPQSDLG